MPKISSPRRHREADDTISWHDLTPEQRCGFMGEYAGAEHVNARCLARALNENITRTSAAQWLGEIDQTNDQIEKLLEELQRSRAAGRPSAEEIEEHGKKISHLRRKADWARLMFNSETLTWIRARNSANFLWLAEYVREHARSDFPALDLLTEGPPGDKTLDDVILDEFLRCSGCNILGAPAPLPRCLPTKKGLRKMVDKTWEERLGKCSDNIGPDFSRALQALGLAGLPKAGRG